MKTIVTTMLVLSHFLTPYPSYENKVIEGIFYFDRSPVSVTITNGKIVEIKHLERDIDGLDTYVAPGLIDIQVNGYMGVDFSGPDLTVEGVRKATKALWKAGVTTYFPTVITSNIDRMKKNFAVLAEARKDPEIRRSIPGFHMTKEEVRTFYKAKGVENTILISDALDLAGLPPGEYTRGERTLLLTPNVVKLPKENVLAGAASPISKCVGVIMDFTGCGLHNAVRMASTNPAKMFSLDDRGEIAQDKRADLILFTMEDNKLVVKKTFVAGQLVYSKE